MDAHRGAEELLTIGAVERHVLAANEEYTPLDGDGFLDLGAPASITSAGDLAGRPGSFVLLAPGGVGKSVVLDGLRRREDGFEVDLVGLRGADSGTSSTSLRPRRRPKFAPRYGSHSKTAPNGGAHRSTSTSPETWRPIWPPS
ncbi:hypothetical protein [Micromonospora sonneratiae]|uniref:AAA ATPase domain-containing protein n=1 Tax=Micromonospora sonneratiae TaxID=1184706 RepID=A0ABW3YAL9_9ACTN